MVIILFLIVMYELKISIIFNDATEKRELQVM